MSTSFLKPDMAQLFVDYGDEFLTRHPQSAQNKKLIHLIKICRTSKLGGHLKRCSKCHFEKPFYNSCRSRLCPKCQALSGARWVEERKQEILPVPYFHCVFTLPHELNPLAKLNPKAIYNFLFASVSETLQKFGQREFNNSKLGFISVLHTWNQKLDLHIHLHCIVPAGALNIKSGSWVESKHHDFLFPIQAMSSVFKAKFIEKIRLNLKNLKLPFMLQNHHDISNFLDSLWNKYWIVYAKAPFQGPAQVLGYLARYTHRTAISNNRIVSVDTHNQNVAFKYRDRRDHDKEKIIDLNVFQFLKRFMQHALPKGFQRIRYQGFLANPSKTKSINTILAIKKIPKTFSISKIKMSLGETFFKIFHRQIDACPRCHSPSTFQPLFSVFSPKPP
jgi:hypothetical protein